MGLRLTTAMTLVMSLGLLAACGEDEAEVVVEETDAEVVVDEAPVDEAEVVVEEEPAEEVVVAEEVVEEEPAEEVVVAEEEVVEEMRTSSPRPGGGDAIELDTTVESDGEPIVATAGDEAVVEESDAADATRRGRGGDRGR